MKKEHESLIRKDGFQTLLASLVCILGGLIVGYLVLLIIEPSGAFEAIVAVMKSFLRFPGAAEAQVFRPGAGAHGAAAAVRPVRPVCLQGGHVQYRRGGSVLRRRLRRAVCRAGVESALVCLHPAGYAGGRAAGYAGGCAADAVQRQRGHFRHHAQLDHPVSDQPGAGHGEESHQPLYQDPPVHQPRRAHPQPGTGKALQQRKERYHRHSSLRF